MANLGIEDGCAAVVETPEQFREAIAVLAKAIVELQQLTKGQSELLRAMDLRVRSVVALLDSHQAVLIAAGLATLRPTEDPIVH